MTALSTRPCRYLQDDAARTRRGAGGVERVEVSGFVAAGFRHRTSRANDPLLHTHVLVANLARTVDDDVWRTLDSRRLFQHARTAGFVYQAHLRHELTRSLGVAWQPVTNGVADIADVPREWIDHFSQRRAAIVDHLDDHGQHGAKAAQVATLATRSAKETIRSEASLRTEWDARANDLGVPDDWTASARLRAAPTAPDLERLRPRVGRTTRVSRKSGRPSSATTSCDAVAERLPTGADVATVATHRGRPARWGRRCPGPDRAALVPRPDRRSHSTTHASRPGALLLTEQRARASSQLGHRRRPRDRASIRSLTTSRNAARSSDEQAAMVRHLTTSGNGVDTVIGRAGTGKTYALAAARETWEAAGLHVAGVAVAARAAQELQHAAGIPATTVAAMLHRLDRSPTKHGPTTPLPAGSVLVVDEAGMVGTRDLARLIDHAAAADAKVVLVGDPRQLPEIDAGGLFAHLAEHLPTVELTDQPTPAPRLGGGRARRTCATATSTELWLPIAPHDRVITTATPDDARARLVDDWWAADRAEAMTRSCSLSAAPTSQPSTQRLGTTSPPQATCTAPTLRVDDREFQAGDRIVCLRNDRRARRRQRDARNGGHGGPGTRRTARHHRPTAHGVELRCRLPRRRPRDPRLRRHRPQGAGPDRRHARSSSATTWCPASGATSRCRAAASTTGCTCPKQRATATTSTRTTTPPPRRRHNASGVAWPLAGPRRWPTPSSPRSTHAAPEDRDPARRRPPRRHRDHAPCHLHHHRHDRRCAADGEVVHRCTIHLTEPSTGPCNLVRSNGRQHDDHDTTARPSTPTTASSARPNSRTSWACRWPRSTSTATAARDRPASRSAGTCATGGPTSRRGCTPTATAHAADGPHREARAPARHRLARPLPRPRRTRTQPHVRPPHRRRTVPGQRHGLDQPRRLDRPDRRPDHDRRMGARVAGHQAPAQAQDPRQLPVAAALPDPAHVRRHADGQARTRPGRAVDLGHGGRGPVGLPHPPVVQRARIDARRRHRQQHDPAQRRPRGRAAPHPAQPTPLPDRGPGHAPGRRRATDPPRPDPRAGLLRDPVGRSRRAASWPV